VVVGADGVTSPIARALRPESNQHVDMHRAVALRAYIEDLEEYPGEVEFYLYKDILPGYAWIFPTGPNQANIGLGMRLDHFRQRKENLKTLLQQFLDMPAIKNGSSGVANCGTWPPGSLTLARRRICSTPMTVPCWWGMRPVLSTR
jgi:flavin-dependent dehydrogenase